MKLIRTWMLVPFLGLLVAVPGSLSAQDPGARPANFRSLVEQGNLVAVVLEHAGDLGLALTEEQAGNLEILREEWERIVLPHQEELTRLLGESEGRPVALQQLARHSDVVTRESRAAFQAAREEILQPDQWTRVEAFLIGRVGGTL